MITELDKIRSSITISLGAKNRLRKEKGNMSYEDYINYLLLSKEQTVVKSENTIEIQQFSRLSATYFFEKYAITFKYNKHNNSTNHVFDIQIKTIRLEGKKIPAKKFFRNSNKLDILKKQYKIYFELLQHAIKKDTHSQFKHKGRFEDYFLWQEEFKKLNLSKRAFEEDVMEKLENYQEGIDAFD